MKRFWHLALPPAALLFQALFPGFVYIVSYAAFGATPALAESTVWPLSMMVLVLLAAMGMALCCTAIYLLLTRSRKLVAIPMVVVFCVPAMVLASLYVHAVLVFLTVI